jgi:hypothetical protein
MTSAQIEQRRSTAQRNVRSTEVTTNRGAPPIHGVMAGTG